MPTLPRRGPSRSVIGVTVVAFWTILLLPALNSYYTNVPEVYVRWAERLTTSDRAALEERFRLSHPVPHVSDPRTWKYEIADASPRNLRDLVDHPSVADTHGIIKTTAELESPPAGFLSYVMPSVPLAGALALLLMALLVRPPDGSGFRLNRDARFWFVDLYIWAAIAFLTFGYQLEAHDSMTNDHAGYLAMAQQIVLGELPIRDFLEHGTLLHSLISAVLQWSFGHHLLAEMLVCTSFIAIGHGLTFVLASSLARSTLVGFLLTLSSLLTTPRPYSYPKIFIYPLAVYLLWRYIRRPSRVNMVIVSFVAALALLFRMDHGVVVFLSAVAVIGFREGLTPIRRTASAIGAFTLAFELWLTPFLLYLAFSGGVFRHVRSIFEFGGRALGRENPLVLSVLNLSSYAPSLATTVAGVH